MRELGGVARRSGVCQLSPSMRILVTGSNGHIGNHVVRDLAKRGHEVVALVREGADLSGHDGLAVTHARGDVLDAASVERAADGCAAVIHLAAVFKLGTRDVAAIVEPAVRGTENVLRAAKAQRARVVHCSSTYAVGFSTRPEPLDEKSWNERLDDPYAAAKTLSERRAWEVARDLGVEVVSINPTAVLGPLDYRCTPSHALLLGVLKSPASYQGGASYSDVRDVSFVLCEALTKGTPGERYLVTGENMAVPDLVAFICERTGKKPMPSPLPRGVVLPVWRSMEVVLGLFGGQMPIASGVLAEFYGRWPWFDSTKAQSTFDWKPHPVRDTVDLALHWCLHRGWIRGPVRDRLRETLGQAPSFE